MINLKTAYKQIYNICIYIYIYKECSGRAGVTVVSVLLGAAVEVSVVSNPTFAK